MFPNFHQNPWPSGAEHSWSCPGIAQKSNFLKNKQFYRKSTWNKLQLFFGDQKLCIWTFLSRTDSLVKICKNRSKIMHVTPKSSTYGALQTKPWVELKNVIYYFVPYNPLNKLSVNHNSVGWIFFELHHFFSQSDSWN